MESLLVDPEEAGLRIDRLLTLRYPLFSRTYFQKLIEDGFVLLNGEKIKKRLVPGEGDEIEVSFQCNPEISLEPENIPLEILFEDDHLLAVNKPAGMVVHPAPGHPNKTFVNALLYHCKDLKGVDRLRPGIVHRLDKDTSGLLLAAKTDIAHHKLVESFSSRQIEKTYLAICLGKPVNTTINAPIGRHPTKRKEMAISVNGRGKDAMTEIQVLAFNDRMSLVLAKPRTGRTHQIRVHLKHIGCPVLGDPVYGRATDWKVERQLLHAYRLDFLHPITSLPLSLLAPLPEDMKEWIGKIAK
jgi:23S rRNA pseudouridine1911/1915/1917 synthase